MSNLANLKPAVERKSGHRPVSFDAQELRSLLRFDVESLRKNGFHPSLIEGLQVFNDRLEAMLGNPDASEYLSTLTAENTYTSSGIRVLSMTSIKEEIHELEPGAILFRHGYLPIASSVGGNVVCLHVATNRVVWADHDSFGGEEISFQNRVTKKWEYVPWSPDNIEKTLVPLAPDLKSFLSDLLDDKLEPQLDKLD